MIRALLVGEEPDVVLGYEYVTEEPYDAVVLLALSQGKSVYLYTPGLPEVPKNRAIAASLTSAQRELKNWGVLFTDGGRRRLVTAEEAREMKRCGKRPDAHTMLTPLAKEILEGKS